MTTKDILTAFLKETVSKMEEKTFEEWNAFFKKYHSLDREYSYLDGTHHCLELQYLEIKLDYIHILVTATNDEGECMSEDFIIENKRHK